MISAPLRSALRRSLRPHGQPAFALGCRWTQQAPLAGAPDVEQLSAEWGKIHTFFESAHFGSDQHRFEDNFTLLLQERFGFDGDSRSRDEESKLRVHADPKKRVDPVDLMYAWLRDSSNTLIPQDALLHLLSSVEELLRKTSSPLVDLTVPKSGLDPKLVIVGDTHGQLIDILHALHTQGPPSESCTYVFNGDIADRGTHAVEIMILVLAFKLRHPQHVHFLRGNHENRQINERPRDWGGGFAEECLAKYGAQVYEQLQRIFLQLPLFAVIEDDIFVVHAGLFRTPDVTLDRLRKLSSWQTHYVMQSDGEETSMTEDEAILLDAQWADPHPMTGFRPSKRGPHLLDFGRDVTQQFLETNRLSLCVRSHEVPRSGRGFAYSHGNRLLTVFSASNYGGVMGNRGAVALVRSKDATASLTENQKTFGKLTLEVVEHDISAWDAASSSGVFRSASVAEKVLAGQRNCPVQAALGILSFHRERLRSRCNAKDIEGEGYISKAAFLEELAEISNEIGWECLLSHCFELPNRVPYSNFLDAIRVKWMYSSAEQAATLVDTILSAKLPLEDVGTLLGQKCIEVDGVEQCMFMDVRRAAKLLAPDISRVQLEELSPFFGGDDGVQPDEFLSRLMLFAPPPASGEPMQALLGELATALRVWAGTLETSVIVWKLFQAYDSDGTGVLSIPDLTESLSDILSTTRGNVSGRSDLLFQQDGNGVFTVDKLRLQSALSAFDSKASGTISFLELAHALGPTPGTEAPASVRAIAERHIQHSRDGDVVEFIFSYRGALLHGCEVIDMAATGLVEAEAFLQVTKSLASAMAHDLPERQLESLRDILGTRLFPYALALSRFEHTFDKALANRAV